MGYILLAIVVLVVCILLIIFIKEDIVKCVSAVFLCVDIILSIVLPINTAMSTREIDETIETYNNLKAQVEVINSSDDKALRNAIIPDLQKKVDKMNNTIAENNSRCDNWWNSVFYYEEIGELEPLKIEY